MRRSILLPHRLPRPGRGRGVIPRISTAPGVFETQPADRKIDRHLHRHAYVSLVLAGGYLEAGDEGRRIVEPGDLLVHDAFESHTNEISAKGARMLNLTLGLQGTGRLRAGRVRDLDAVIRTAERDPVEAWIHVEEDLDPVVRRQSDWPDELALALQGDPTQRLGVWAEKRGLSAEEVSRGFRLAYRTTPKQFRAMARAKGAGRALCAGRPVADVIGQFGFSDQAHLCRAIRALTGMPPRRLMQVYSIRP